MAKILNIACIAVAIGMFGSSALAQEGPGRAPMTPEQRAARFVAADTNKDDKLDKGEFVASLPERAQAMGDEIWTRMDEDGDGAITKDQYINMQMRRPG